MGYNKDWQISFTQRPYKVLVPISWEAHRKIGMNRSADYKTIQTRGTSEMRVGKGLFNYSVSDVSVDVLLVIKIK